MKKESEGVYYFKVGSSTVLVFRTGSRNWGVCV